MGRVRSPWMLTLLASIPAGDVCWEWVGQINRGGYGVAGGPLAHRRVYGLFYRSIPDAEQVHHLCRNAKCVNPRHLQLLPAVTHGAMSNRSLCSHCINGHEYTADNTVWFKPKDQRNPSRRCLTCKRNNEAERRARAKAGR
jgi:hypothetical protein